MMRSVLLPTEPSIRQTDAILSRIERELEKLGAKVERPNVAAVRFRTPLPWQAPRLGALLAVTSGRATMSAGAGERWRVRYELRFPLLRLLGLALSIALVTAGWHWARVTLLNAVLLLWVACYGIPYLAANLRFRRIVEAAATESVARKRTGQTGENPVVSEARPTPTDTGQQPV